MQDHHAETALRTFSTCPPVTDEGWDGYRRRIVEVARWSEEHGCEGMLIYADNRQVDPWMVSQVVLESTDALAPLPAVQPAYMHPFTVASRLAAFGHLYGRRLVLNMVAGGFRNDLVALGDPTSHDRRYDRLIEYTRIVLDLVRGEGPVTFDGDFYRVENLKLPEPLPPELVPEIFVSGSSDAGKAAAETLGATPVRYPEPSDEDEGVPEDHDGRTGIRLGVIARDDPDEAWRVALTRFPPDREGQLARQLANKVSDSVWHEKLTALARETRDEQGPYWLVPFENYKTMCPYLVGGYDRVAREIARYAELGYDTVILDVPPSAEELGHTREAFRRAAAEADGAVREVVA